MHTPTKAVTAHVRLCQGVYVPSMSVTPYPSSNPEYSKTIKAEARFKRKLFKPNQAIENFFTKLMAIKQSDVDAKKAQTDRWKRSFQPTT